MYREWVSRVPHTVVWQRLVPSDDSVQRVLPDGCMDLIWSDGSLFVAGPDTAAQLPTVSAGTSYTGLRFAPGNGPAVIGLPAHELRDQRVPLAQLWPATHVADLVEQLQAAANPARALEEIAAGRLRRAGPPDKMMAEVARRLRAGMPVAAVAAAVNVSERQLHRRCQTAFGYGPKTLVRILRMNRAVDLARTGRPFAAVAAATGYADQAHLAREVKALAGVSLGVLIN
ncbi:MAG TPA: helix-turn-helix domain-containing protein [Micromonosporaceae bacterium]|nr:helix-turn-helix domain-containing protein [Micromonosporaceae bacterium]